MQTRNAPKTIRQDALDRKTVFKAVLDNPLVVPWPPVPSHLRSQILDALLDLLAGVSDYKPPRNAQPPARPPILDHLVIGVNAVTRALEPPYFATKRSAADDVDDAAKARAAKRRKKIERLTQQVARDEKEAPRLAEVLRRTGRRTILPAPFETAHEMIPDTASGGTVSKPLRRYSREKRRRARRTACRQIFLARRRKDTLTALTTPSARATETSAPEETQMANDRQDAADQRLLHVVVCRPDIDPPSLVAHLPFLVARQNSSLKSPSERDRVSLVQLNAGAESKLCRALHLRRAAVIGLKASCPGLVHLERLLEVLPSVRPRADWLTSSGREMFASTAIKHLKTVVPLDTRDARKARQLDRHEWYTERSKRMKRASVDRPGRG